MLATDELCALIEDHESDRLKLTVSKTNTDKFGEAICAFANDFPITKSRVTSSSAWRTTGQSVVRPSATNCYGISETCARTSISSRCR